jgi:hypothetical protein
MLSLLFLLMISSLYLCKHVLGKKTTANRAPLGTVRVNQIKKDSLWKLSGPESGRKVELLEYKAQMLAKMVRREEMAKKRALAKSLQPVEEYVTQVQVLDEKDHQSLQVEHPVEMNEEAPVEARKIPKRLRLLSRKRDSTA